MFNIAGIGTKEMTQKSLLDGKKVLVVDDEQDVLDTLAELLSMCEVSKALSFAEGKDLLDSSSFDLVILDIMGVEGFDLLKITTTKKITSVMLTAHALSPENVVRSYKGGAAYYLPKEEMVNIVSFLEEILTAIDQGMNPWDRWLHRLADFCERTFGEKWQDKDKDFWDKFPFY